MYIWFFLCTYIYRFIYKTHLPPLRWKELGKVEEVEKGAQKKWRGRDTWLEKEGGPFPQVKGGTAAPLTVILRPLLVEVGVCRQFEVPPLVAVVTPLAAEGGGREEEVAGKVAGLGALSLTDSHSDAPLVLVPSDGVGAVGKVSRLQAGWTRYLRGRGPFCRESGGRGRGRSRQRPTRLPPTFTQQCPNRKKRKVWALERKIMQNRRTQEK